MDSFGRSRTPSNQRCSKRALVLTNMYEHRSIGRSRLHWGARQQSQDAIGKVGGTMNKASAIALTAIVLAMPANGQDSIAKQLAARIELHSIPSLTLSDEQFLKGDSAAGKPVVVSGELRIAQGSGRLPVVVLIHGSSGMGANIDFWTRELNEMGVSTFALDGFTGRKWTNVNPDQASLG